MTGSCLLQEQHHKVPFNVLSVLLKWYQSPVVNQQIEKTNPCIFGATFPRTPKAFYFLEMSREWVEISSFWPGLLKLQPSLKGSTELVYM